MCWKIVRSVLLVGLTLAQTQVVLAQGAQQAPTVEAILRKVLERAKLSLEQKPETRYSWTERVVTEKLGDDGAVREKEDRLYEVVTVNGASYERLLKKDGKPLTPSELKKEQSREKKFREELAKSKGKAPDPENSVAFDEALAAKYRFALAEQVTVGDRPAYLITFEPRGKDLTVTRRMDRLLNKLRGRIWVDRQDYELVRIEARLLEPVKMWGGIVATIREFELELDQARLDQDAWLPRSIAIKIRGRFFIKSFHERSVIENDSFRKLS